MPTAAQMRKLALSMPEAEEKSHFEQPDFRVNGKIFAGVSRDGVRGNLKLTPEIQSTVVDDDGTFTPAAGAWGRSGWTYVELATVDISMLGDLIVEAWRLVAPKKLITTYDEGLLGTSRSTTTQKTTSAKKSNATKPSGTKRTATKKKTASAKKRG